MTATFACRAIVQFIHRAAKMSAEPTMPKKPHWYPKTVRSLQIPPRVLGREELEALLTAAHVPPVIRGLLTRPFMYVADADFKLVAAFLDGYDVATHRGALIGFREWLIPRVNGASNFTWDGLVPFLLRDPPRGTPKERVQEMRISQFAELIAAFYSDRTKGSGLRAIFLRYEEWLERQSWYNETWPDWVDVNLRRRRRKPAPDRTGRTRPRRAKKN